MIRPLITVIRLAVTWGVTHGCTVFLSGRSRMISHYAQAYNQTNPIMINIGIACRERRCDSKNFGTRIT
jgi:hypothetical protein